MKKMLSNHKSRKYLQLNNGNSKSLCKDSTYNRQDIEHPLKIKSSTIFLYYQKHKITITMQSPILFEVATQKMFEQIAVFEKYTNKSSKLERKAIMSTIVGFSSIEGDLNFDYRFSLQKGTFEGVKYLRPFYSNDHFGLSSRPRYHVCQCLAIGGFSKVYLCRSRINGKFYAIKFIRKQIEGRNASKGEQKWQGMVNQIMISKEMNHPLIVKLLDAFETKKFYCLTLEYCPGGELFYLLKKIKYMNEEDARFYFMQILYAMEYLHKKQIIYRDLKPQNILIDHQGNIKLVDFGLSKDLSEKTKTYSYCGSAEYMAPEMILRIGHSYPLDYYSLGTLLYQLVTGLPPYYTKDEEQLRQSIIQSPLEFPSRFQLSDELKDLLSKLLIKDPKLRLGSYAGIKQILFHPWIGKIKATDILNKKITPPFIPDISAHNFDKEELGDDQVQFTHDVLQDINQTANIRHYFRQQTIQNQDLFNQKYINLAEKYLEEYHLKEKQNKCLNNITTYINNQNKDQMNIILKIYAPEKGIIKSNFKTKNYRKFLKDRKNHLKDQLSAQKNSAEHSPSIVKQIHKRQIPQIGLIKQASLNKSSGSSFNKVIRRNYLQGIKFRCKQNNIQNNQNQEKQNK